MNDDTRTAGDATPAGGTYLTGGAAQASGSELDFPPTWATKDTLPRFSPITGLTMQSVTGGKLMANWVTIEPHRDVPRHQHPHEQLGIMLEGALELTIGDETRLIRPGDAYTIPPNLPHSARTHDEGCVVLDIFTPPREDYR
jgi:quercetin dioxygenase-like cupin family protein